MKLDEYLRSERIEVEYCRTRTICPFKTICGKGTDDEALYPAIIEIEHGDVLWADLRRDQRVLAVKEGVMLCMLTNHPDEEVPFVLMGPGSTDGLGQLYAPREALSASYLRALTSGKVCSFSAKAFRRATEAEENPYSQKLMAMGLTHLLAAASIQLKIALRPLLRDKLLLLLPYFSDLMARGGKPDTDTNVIRLTHGELAGLLNADRASVTRALHELEDAGFLELGFKSIILKPPIFEEHPITLDDAQGFPVQIDF